MLEPHYNYWHILHNAYFSHYFRAWLYLDFYLVGRIPFALFLRWARIISNKFARLNMCTNYRNNLYIEVMKIYKFCPEIALNNFHNLIIKSFFNYLAHLKG